MYFTHAGVFCILHPSTVFGSVQYCQCVRRVVHPHGAKGCVASCRTVSGRDAGFSLATCAECLVATYRSSTCCDACCALTTLQWVARGALSKCWQLRRLLWPCDFALSGTWAFQNALQGRPLKPPQLTGAVKATEMLLSHLMRVIKCALILEFPFRTGFANQS
jgi:hypothetical protein